MTVMTSAIAVSVQSVQRFPFISSSRAAQLAKKRKASNDDGDEEGELAQPERTVRVAGPSPNAAQRQATSGDDRKPVRTRLGDNTGVTSQPKVPLRSRLGKPAAGQAPLQVPSEVRR